MSVSKLKPERTLPPGHVRTQRELAAAVGVTVRTVGRWLHEENMPVEDHGGYSVKTVMDWRRELEDERKPSPSAEQDWEALYEKSRAQLKEIELLKVQGELLEREAIEREWGARVLEVSQALDRMGTALAPKCENRPARKIKKMIDAYTRDVREKYANQGAASGKKQIRRGRGRPPTKK